MTDDLLAVRSEEFRGNVVVLHLSGELDLGNAAQLEQRLAESVSTARAVIVDINDLQYMDSSGFRTLHRAAEDGTILMVVDPKARLARAVRLSGLDTLIDIYDDLDAARIAASP